MSHRIDRRRKADRRLFIGCWVLAGLLHVVLFLVVPGFGRDGLARPGLSLELAETPAPGATLLDLFFGPPAISGPSGRVSVEPPERFLETERLVHVPAACLAVIRSSGNDIRGSVRLRVKVTGRVDVTGVVRSSGIRCADDLLERVAGDLLYHWLPSGDFPAPVQLTQPMRLSENTDR
ncbi:MAG: hypothetical protein OXU74_17730 [Gemmatimonadota bacterium]|nr:hypothetical protein [Gemmatimonadota bacterium]